MLTALKDGYFGLFYFRGRMAIGHFWVFAAANFLLLCIATAFVFGPVFAEMGAKIDAIAKTHPQDVTVRQGPGQYSVEIRGNHPELMPDFDRLIAGISVLGVVFVILMAAAVARRLHDGNRRAWWGALPLPFLAIGLAVMPRLIRQFQTMGENNGARPDFGLFAALFANNLIYLACLLGLIVLLALPGTVGANRFGNLPSKGV